MDKFGNPGSAGQDTLLLPDGPGRPPAASITAVSREIAATQPDRPADARMITAGRAVGMQMKRRSPAGVWLRSAVTLGGYALYWWYRIHTELREYDRRRHVTPVFELLSISLLAWTVILPLMSIGSLAQQLRIAQGTAGLRQDCSGPKGISLALLFGAHLVYYQRKLNEIIAVNPGTPGEPIWLKV